MSSWYQRFAFSLVKGFYVPRLISRYSVRFTGNDKEPAEPHLLIANHQHMDDSYVLARHMASPVRAMADREASSALQLALGKLLGLYFRRPGVDDTALIRQTKSFLNEGHSVGIFPSGAMSWDGRDEIDYLQTAKLAKLLRVPLRMARISGLYLAKPRWAESARVTEVGVHWTMLQAMEVREMKAGELAGRIRDALAHDEVRSLRGAEVQGGKLAEGIHNLIWHCPSCNGHNGIHGVGNEILCGRCGGGWVLRGDLSLPDGPFADIVSWHDWQIGRLSEQIAADEDGDFPRLDTTGAALISHDQRSPRRNRNVVREVRAEYRNGEMHVSGNGTHGISFPLGSVRAPRILKNRSFCFSHGEQRFQLEAPGQNLLKWLCMARRLSR
jgi:hypothetical protein